MQWVWGAAVLLLVIVGYVWWLSGRVRRLHRRAEAATAALDAKLVRRAAASAVLAEQLAGPCPKVADDLYAVARAALDASEAEREAAENDLTRTLRELTTLVPAPLQRAPAWPDVVTASRRVGLARQVHTDLVRDARRVRAQVPVRLFRLARPHPEPAYFDIDDPGLDQVPEACADPLPASETA